MHIPSSVINLIKKALEEDIGPGDITTSVLIPDDHESTAQYIAKENFVLAGLPFAKEVFRIVEPAVVFKVFLDDGTAVSRGDVVAEVSGKTCSILSGERVSLNILRRLSGIATLTSSYVEKVKGLGAKIVDTRKTTPCMRFMEKYAVRIGGGSNHRFGLFDGILIKDNHLKVVGSMKEAVMRAKKVHHLLKIEVEVGNLHSLNKAVGAGVDVVMLDNMTISDIKEAVRIAKGKVILEASGNVNLDNVRDIALTGVNLISVGAITHSSPSADISLKLVD